MAALAAGCGFIGGVVAVFIGNWSLIWQFRGLKNALNADKGNNAAQSKRQINREAMFRALNDYSAAKAGGKGDLAAVGEAASKNPDAALALAEQFGIKL